MSGQRVKDLLRTAHLTERDMRLLIDLSRRFKADPTRNRTALSNETVVLYFNKPSTRTRISMAAAVARLGGVPVTVGPNELQLGRGESIEDTAKTVSRYARAFVIRTYADDDVARFAAAASIPVVNALTDRHHPCQSLADVMTLEEYGGPLREQRVAYVGDGNNVCHSLMEAIAILGGRLSIATPPGYEPRGDLLVQAQARACANGGAIELGHDPRVAARDADALYTDTWLSMGVPEEERAERSRAFRSFQVDARLMASAKPGAKFLHCLPAHAGQEVTPQVLESPASVVFEQTENRLHTAVAVLYALLERRIEGVA